jgi:hypothetical protein
VSNGIVRSANDFRLAYRRLQADYDRIYQPKVTEARAVLADPKRKDPNLEEALEAHVRTYLIDGILKALRWVIVPSTPDEIANMIPEVQVDPATGVRRFMDYFGYEREVDQPLLIVEAKRPSEFPRQSGGSTEPSSAIVSGWLLRPDKAHGEWQKWIPSLRDYVVSVFMHTTAYPVRAVITDGNWLVIFENPQDAFGKEGSRDARFIHVFMDSNEVDEQYNLIFRLLDQRSVSRSVVEIAPGAIGGTIDPNQVVQVLHGLLLCYATTNTVGSLIPTISLMPLIFLRSNTGSWVRIAHRGEGYLVPYDYRNLQAHLEEVNVAAEDLLARVNRALNRQIAPTSLEEHYADEKSFEDLLAVEHIPRQRDHFRIVTGKFTHFLLADPTVPNCPHHDFGKSATLHCQVGDLPIINRSIETPRAYFTNMQQHHCCHEDVDAAKHVILSEENEQWCGARSGRRGDVFCKIAPFEEFLCCRTCCFQQVCTASQVLTLPCVLPPA